MPKAHIKLARFWLETHPFRKVHNRILWANQLSNPNSKSKFRAKLSHNPQTKNNQDIKTKDETLNNNINSYQNHNKATYKYILNSLINISSPKESHFLHILSPQAASGCAQYCTWCVTSSRVRRFSRAMTASKICRPTWASKALKTSSRRSTWVVGFWLLPSRLGFGFSVVDLKGSNWINRSVGSRGWEAARNEM